MGRGNSPQIILWGLIMEYLPFKLDKERNVGFGMRAMSIIEKKFNAPIAKIDFNNLTVEDIAIIMCAGLNHEDPSLTPETFMDLVDKHSTMPKIAEVMKQAFTMSFGEEKESKGKNV